eukprot:5878670-Pyramimonas_sp.AAC.1
MRHGGGDAWHAMAYERGSGRTYGRGRRQVARGTEAGKVDEAKRRRGETRDEEDGRMAAGQ